MPTSFVPMLLALQAMSLLGLFVSGGCSLRVAIGQVRHSSPSKAWVGGSLAGLAITFAAVVVMIVVGVPQLVHTIEHLPSGPPVSITFSVSK